MFGNESRQDSQTKRSLITWTSVTIGWWYRNRPPSKARGPSWHAFWKRQPLAEENATKLSRNIQPRTTTWFKIDARTSSALRWGGLCAAAGDFWTRCSTSDAAMLSWKQLTTHIYLRARWPIKIKDERLSHWAPVVVDVGARINYVVFSINNGNRTNLTPIRSAIIRVINKIGRPRRGSPIWLITSMITDQIGQHELLSPNNYNCYNFRKRNAFLFFL